MSKTELTKIEYWEQVVIPPYVKNVWEELASYDDIKVYAVGGAVRDLLMQQRGKKRVNPRIMPTDWDLVTNATPSRIRTIFGARNVIQEENNKKFGVTFIQSLGRTLEVATFREDITIGRKPDVRFSDNYITDSRRRDFTINALYMDLNGIVHDPTESGINHLNNNKLEFIDIPDERITEDPLRLQRGVRFIAMGFKPTGSSRKALFNNTKHLRSFASKVPKEYIRDELLKMMATNLREGMKVMIECGLMDIILPEYMALVGFSQKTDYHLYKLDKHSVETAMYMQKIFKRNDLALDKELVLISLLHDIAKPDFQEIDEATGKARYNGHAKAGAIVVENIFRRLKFPNKSIKRAKVLVENHLVLHQPHTTKVLLRLTDTIEDSGIGMRDILWLYKADLYASRRENSYLPDDHTFPRVRSAIKSKDIMKLLDTAFGKRYDKKLLGEVERRVRQFYYEFPNIATFKLRVKIKDYIRSLTDNV